MFYQLEATYQRQLNVVTSQMLISIPALLKCFRLFLKQKIIPLAPDTSHLSITAAGEDMTPNRSGPLPDLELDLSGFSVAKIGATLTDKKEKKIPPAPDTNHIKLF
jgi:hypothetical protein